LTYLPINPRFGSDYGRQHFLEARLFVATSSLVT
jgi:hypothetical protein